MFDPGYLAGVLEGVAAGVAALLVPVSAILFVMGRSEAAAKALMWAVILAFVSVSGYAVVRWLMGGGGGGAPNYYIVTEPPEYASKYFPVEITVIPVVPSGAHYYVRVDWGDGAGSSGGGVAPRPICFRHTYRSEGSYTVSVSVEECWNNRCGVARRVSYDVRVSAPWNEIASVIGGMGENLSRTNAGFWTPLYWVAGKLVEAAGEIFRDVCDFMAGFMAEHGIYAGYAFYYYTTMPTSDSLPGLRSTYGAAEQWALFLLPLALLVNILWRAYWEFERDFSLLDVAREFVWVVFIIVLGLYIYDAAADIVNIVGLSVSQLGQLSAPYSIAVGFLAVTAAVGVFSPLAANLAALTAVALILLVLGGILKWLLAVALVACIPLLAVIWLIPPLRGLVSSITSILAGLFVFTLVSAVFSRLVSEVSSSLSLGAGNLGSVVFALIMPVVYLVIGPMILQHIGGALGGHFLPSMRYMLRYGFGIIPMVFPSKTAEQVAPVALAATAGGAGAAPAAAAAGTSGVASTGTAYLAPVVGTTTLRNPLAQQLMKQRTMGTTTLIREEKHPRLHTALHIAKAAITGKPPEYELSPREKAAYYALKYTVGRTIRNLRQAGETFRRRFYMETGIWIPGRLPREQELKKAAEITVKTGKWIKEKGVVVAKKFNSGIRAVTNSILERQREIRGEY